MVILAFSSDSLSGIASTLLIFTETHLLTYLMFYIISLLWFYFLLASICMSNLFYFLILASIILPIVSWGKLLILNFTPLWVKIQSYKSLECFHCIQFKLTSWNLISLTKTISTFCIGCFFDPLGFDMLLIFKYFLRFRLFFWFLFLSLILLWSEVTIPTCTPCKVHLMDHKSLKQIIFFWLFYKCLIKLI